MARPTMEQLRGIGNATQLFRWNLQFVTFPTALQAPPSSDALNLRCESVDLPKLTGTNTAINIRGHEVVQPGKYTYTKKSQFTMLETVDSVVHSFLRAWREIVWQTGTGVQVSKAEASCDILITRLDQSDNGIWEYTLKGCFLDEYNPGATLDSSGQDPLKPVISLAWDYFTDRKL